MKLNTILLRCSILTFFIFFFNLPCFSEKILIIEYDEVKNFCIERSYSDYIVIDEPYFIKNLKCRDYYFDSSYKLPDIINFIKNNVIDFSEYSNFRNLKLTDKIFIKKIIILDSNYKILEKNGKRYYIFHVCYPSIKSKNIFEKLKDLIYGSN